MSFDFNVVFYSFLNFVLLQFLDLVFLSSDFLLQVWEFGLHDRLVHHVSGFDKVPFPIIKAITDWLHISLSICWCSFYELWIFSQRRLDAIRVHCLILICVCSTWIGRIACPSFIFLLGYCSNLLLICGWLHGWPLKRSWHPLLNFSLGILRFYGRFSSWQLKRKYSRL